MRLDSSGERIRTRILNRRHERLSSSSHDQPEHDQPEHDQPEHDQPEHDQHQSVIAPSWVAMRCPKNLTFQKILGWVPNHQEILNHYG